MLEDCLGWDIKKNKRKREGMFGKMEAFDGTVEEQERRTLHIHFLLWILNFNSMRGNMFSQDFQTRERARKCMIEYCSKIMTSSYPDFNLTHTKSKESDEKCLGDIIPVDDQVIRNLRHKSKCIDEKGVIAKCNACKQSFTMSKIVNNPLNNWKAKLASEKTFNFQHLVSRERSNVYAMFFPYCKAAVSKNQSRM